MKITPKSFLRTAVLLSCFFTGSVHAQTNILKAGTSAFFISDNSYERSYLAVQSFGISLERQFTPKVSLSLHANTGFMVGNNLGLDNREVGFRVNSAELELRFYPNNLGKGFYAGTSVLYYRQNVALENAFVRKHLIGSHINFGVQYPVGKRTYVQANLQTGIYGFGDLAFVIRYGANLMAGYRF